MGKLDEVDLTRSLSRKEEARALERAQARLAQLRLTLGGQIGEQRIGPPVLRPLRGLGRLRQGRGDQAPGRTARSAPRPRLPVRGADPRREAPSLPVALLAVRCRAGEGWPIFDRSWYGRVLVERVEGFATREQWLRAYDEINRLERSLAARGDDPDQALAADLRRRSS